MRGVRCAVRPERVAGERGRVGRREQRRESVRPIETGGEAMVEPARRLIGERRADGRAIRVRLVVVLVRLVGRDERPALHRLSRQRRGEPGTLAVAAEEKSLRRLAVERLAQARVDRRDRELEVGPAIGRVREVRAQRVAQIEVVEQHAFFEAVIAGDEVVVAIAAAARVERVATQRAVVRRARDTR